MQRRTFAIRVFGIISILLPGPVIVLTTMYELSYFASPTSTDMAIENGNLVLCAVL